MWKMTEEKGDKKAIPGRIIPRRHYDAIPGTVLISMDRIIDCCYDESEKDYDRLDGYRDLSNHIFLDMKIVRGFLNELKHCDEPLAPCVEENDAEAESFAEKQNVS